MSLYVYEPVQDSMPLNYGYMENVIEAHSEQVEGFLDDDKSDVVGWHERKLKLCLHILTISVLMTRFGRDDLGLSLLNIWQILSSAEYLLWAELFKTAI